MEIIKSIFSIYKVDIPEFKILYGYIDEEGIELVDKILDEVIKLIESKIKIRYQLFEYNAIKGIIFRQDNIPAWKDLICELLDKDKSDSQKNGNFNFEPKDIMNTRASYLMLYYYNNKIYASTGGTSSFLIEKFVVKNYGLHMLTKLIKKSDSTIKYVGEVSTSGYQADIKHSNRQIVPFDIEQNETSIYKEIDIYSNKEFLKGLGIKIDKDESKTKQTQIDNKHSMIIHRPISIVELKDVIEHLDKIENRKENFILSYLVEAKVKHINNTDLFDTLASEIFDKKYDSALIVGDDYEKYNCISSKYIILDENDKEIKTFDYTIGILDVIDVIEEKYKKVTISRLKTVINKWKIETFDDSGEPVVYSTEIKNLLEAFIVFNNIQCYLIYGSWYIFDIEYEDTLTKNFEELFDEFLGKTNTLNNKFGLISKERNEDEYNEELKRNNKVLVTHEVKLSNIELSDAIFETNDTIYLMHNKTKHDGKGIRDLVGQIDTASKYLSYAIKSYDARKILGNYYDEIVKKGRDVAKIAHDKDEFIEKFLRKDICYIAGFIKGYRKDTNVNYSKHFLVDMKRRLTSRGHQFLVMNLTK